MNSNVQILSISFKYSEKHNVTSSDRKRYEDHLKDVLASQIGPELLKHGLVEINFIKPAPNSEDAHRGLAECQGRIAVVSQATTAMLAAQIDAAYARGRREVLREFERACAIACSDYIEYRQQLTRMMQNTQRQQFEIERATPWFPMNAHQDRLQRVEYRYEDGTISDSPRLRTMARFPLPDLADIKRGFGDLATTVRDETRVLLPIAWRYKR